MANEILYSGAGDRRLSEILYGAAHVLLADFVNLLRVPGAALYRGDISGSGSTVMKVAQIDYDVTAAAVAEYAAPSNTGLTDASVTLTIARQSIKSVVSDLHQITSSLNEDKLAQLAYRSVLGIYNRENDMLCNLFSSVTNTQGSTGTQFSVDYFYDMKFALIDALNPMGQTILAMSQKSYTQLMSDLRGETGIEAMNPLVQPLLNGQNGSFAGNFRGVDIWLSDSCPTSGSDVISCMWTPGAFHYDDARLQIYEGNNQIVMENAEIGMKFKHDNDNAASELVADRYLGVGICENARAVRALSLNS